MIAQLPMYDWPEQRAATDALWATIRDALRRRGFAAPDRLDRTQDAARVRTDPGLLLSQTCGMPYRQGLHGRVRIIGAFDAALPGIPAGYYASRILVRAGDPRRTLADFNGATLALNGFDSQSGWAAIGIAAQAAGIAFGAFYRCGAHRHSAVAVARGTADLAAIDALSWRLFRHHEGALAARLCVLETTPPTPGLPLITASGRDPELLFAAIRAGIAALPARLRALLGIQGIVHIPARAYLTVPTPQLPEVALSCRNHRPGAASGTIAVPVSG